MPETSDTLPICGKRYLTLDKLCDYLGVSRWTVYSWIKRREIPFATIGKRSYRFDQDRIDKWMTERTMATVRDI